jgi:hypothetical protein
MSYADYTRHRPDPPEPPEEPVRLTIALDYDDCYTADPWLWDTFIASARSAGHSVICVTCRHDDPGDSLRKLPIPVYYTEMAPKRWHMEQLGIDVDIWIDDYPECVREGR